MNSLAILTLGFFLGVRHATDSDHVVAVTTIVSRARSARAALWIGALWGVGHTATILTVGGALVLFGWVIPPRVGLSMEMAVAVMLIGLGAMNLSGALSRIGQVAHQHAHPHAAIAHPVAPESTSPWRAPLRPLAIGVVHGLAGSAAVALLVLATIKSAGTALVYLAIFGAGTVAGMMLLTLAMAVPLGALTSRFAGAERRIAHVTGLVSVALGLFLAYRIGITDGLLLGTPNWDPR